MYYALSKFPHTTAIAAGMRARAGSRRWIGSLPCMVEITSPHPIDRGDSR